MFESEIEQLTKQGAPFAQNLYELRERIKTTGDKTAASILLDPPTPDTLRNFNELKQRTQPLKQLLDSVDAKYTKCEAKYLKT